MQQRASRQHCRSKKSLIPSCRATAAKQDPLHYVASSQEGNMLAGTAHHLGCSLGRAGCQSLHDGCCCHCRRHACCWRRPVHSRWDWLPCLGTRHGSSRLCWHNCALHHTAGHLQVTQAACAGAAGPARAALQEETRYAALAMLCGPSMATDSERSGGCHLGWLM